jgi:hypothetical protein
VIGHLGREERRRLVVLFNARWFELARPWKLIETKTIARHTISSVMILNIFKFKVEDKSIT